MASVTLSLVVLKTRQVDAMRRFYASLGIELVQEQHGKGPVHFAGKVGNVMLEVYPLAEEGATAEATTRFGFTIQSVNMVVEELRGLSAPIDTEPQATKSGVRAVVRDPDGRAVELYQR
jgi:lactoylglutathione lyase